MSGVGLCGFSFALFVFGFATMRVYAACGGTSIFP